MVNTQKQISIINSPAASSGDLVNTGGIISITGLSPFQTSLLRRLKVYKNMQVQPMVYTITATAVVDNTVQIRFIQNADGYTKNYVYTYTFASTTASALTTDLTAWLTANGFDGTLTSNSGSPTVILTYTCSDTNPNIEIGGMENATVAYAMPTITRGGTAATDIAGTTTVTVTTAAAPAQSFRTGDVVTISGVATMTLTQNGVSGLSSVTCRIVYASATTFTLDGVTATGTNSGTITITKVAQGPVGTIAEVNRIAAENGSDQTATATTYMYDMVEIAVAYNNSILASPGTENYNAILFVKKSLIASPYTNDTNGAALIATLVALETGF
jgi:hypothetical protein